LYGSQAVPFGVLIVLIRISGLLDDEPMIKSSPRLDYADHAPKDGSIELPLLLLVCLAISLLSSCGYSVLSSPLLALPFFAWMDFVRALAGETEFWRLTLPRCNFVDTWNILSPPPILLRSRIDLSEAFATGNVVVLHTGCIEDAGVGTSGESGIPPHD